MKFFSGSLSFIACDWIPPQVSDVKWCARSSAGGNFGSEEEASPPFGGPLAMIVLCPPHSSAKCEPVKEASTIII